jgi:hypothetical protein
LARTTPSAQHVSIAKLTGAPNHVINAVGAALEEITQTTVQELLQIPGTFRLPPVGYL